MAGSTNLSTAVRVMSEFASNTGLSPAATPHRYLWTDAFAVCNYLGLHNLTGEEQYRQLALDLVNNVHIILGQHRSDDSRKGWISGLSEEEGKLHPTAGGLRIGKKMAERSLGDAYNDDLEWDRDGQYYHYLTKWMHALNCISTATANEQYNKWAAELAQGTHDKFTYGSVGGKKRMYWKMSIDLSRPQVPSMGHHDPLDGYITYQQIHRTLTRQGTDGMDLKPQITDMEAICQGKDWVTTDPLGLGGLLCDAYRVMTMVVGKEMDKGEELLERLLDACNTGMKSYVNDRYGNQLKKPAEYRLAFRELGLAIGLQAVGRMQQMLEDHGELVARCIRVPTRLNSLQQYVHIADTINKFWGDPSNQKVRSWTSHLDINMVMLATSAMPDGYLNL